MFSSNNSVSNKHSIKYDIQHYCIHFLSVKEMYWLKKFIKVLLIVQCSNVA